MSKWSIIVCMCCIGHAPIYFQTHSSLSPALLCVSGDWPLQTGFPNCLVTWVPAGLSLWEALGWKEGKDKDISFEVSCHWMVWRAYCGSSCFGDPKPWPLVIPLPLIVPPAQGCEWLPTVTNLNFSFINLYNQFFALNFLCYKSV